MIRKILIFTIIHLYLAGNGSAQTIVNTSDLFRSPDRNSGKGHLIINQDPSLDTLISRYILFNKNQEEKIGYAGVKGFRIQIYASLDLKAKEESSRIEIEFKDQFPAIETYRIFAEPRWYKVRVGNFRSRIEAYKSYLIISKKYPASDLVRDIINLQDLSKKDKQTVPQ